MAGVSGVILVSGDHYRKNYDEVNPMRNFCIDAGVPEDDIVADHTGISTYDSICRAKEIFGAKVILLLKHTTCTVRFTLLASLVLTRNGVTCDLRPYRGQIYREVREFGARVKDFIYTTFKPEPVFLGDPIPLPSSSDVTES